MFPDYQKLIIEDYHHKRATNNIALRLIEPTPRKLKDECMAICQLRFQRRDDRILSVFFGQAADQKSYLQAIDKYEIDKFKPLVNFLKGETTTTDPKNVELLAWLIDFTPRPYELGRRYNHERDSPGKEGTEKGEAIVKELKDSAGELSVIDTASAPYVKTPNYKRWVLLASALILLAVTGISLFLQKSRLPLSYASNGPQFCMYWAEDHYQQVSCNQKMAGVLVIAMDTLRLKNFRKITLPDTITSKAIGYTWYTKYNNNLEFFTADGTHPLHLELRTRPITQYIIDKYIQQDAQTK